MPSVFQHSGLRVEYPENWSLDHVSYDVDRGDANAGNGDTGNGDTGDGVSDGVTTAQVEQVVISSPDTAFWHLSKYSLQTELEPLFDEALAALRTEYPAMETEPAVPSVVEGHQLEGFDVNFICLDLTNSCWLRGFRTEESTFLLYCQAEDREFARVRLVFEAMLASLLRNIG